MDDGVAVAALVVSGIATLISLGSAIFAGLSYRRQVDRDPKPVIVGHWRYEDQTQDPEIESRPRATLFIRNDGSETARDLTMELHPPRREKIANANRLTLSPLAKHEWAISLATGDFSSDGILGSGILIAPAGRAVKGTYRAKLTWRYEPNGRTGKRTFTFRYPKNIETRTEWT